MGVSFSSRSTPQILIGDLSKLSPVEQKLYQLSHCALNRQDPSIGKLCTSLGIKILDFKSDEFVEPDKDNDVSEAENDNNSSVCENRVNLTEDSVSSLFYILMTEKPFYFSQTFTQWRMCMTYENTFSCCRPEKTTIYIQPVDNFPSFIRDFEIKLDHFDEPLNFFTLLQTFAEAFFDGMDVKLLPEVNLMETEWNITSRIHHKTGHKQYFVRDFFPRLAKVTPPDGYCIMGISWTDLYPTESLNFVLGEALNTKKAGIFCFGRYEPKTYDPATHKDITEIDGTLMWRTLKVRCIMNLMLRSAIIAI